MATLNAATSNCSTEGAIPSLKLVVHPYTEIIRADFDDLDDAMNEHETLRAIGRAVRDLQILHVFDEGTPV